MNMDGTILISIEMAFIVVSILMITIAIYILRRARKSLSDESFKSAITWMINSSFLLGIIAAGVAVKTIIPLVPEIDDYLSGLSYTTVLFVLIWLAIICMIKAALFIKDIGKTFGFKDTAEKELPIEGWLERLK